MPQIIKSILGLCLLLSGSCVVAENISSPVWPFPWAKECPPDWEALQGHYTAAPEASIKVPMDLQITVTQQTDGKHVEVTEVSPSGRILATQSVPASEKPEEIRLSMDPGVDPQKPTSGLLQMRFGSEIRDCNRTQLVLTLDFADSANHHEEQYQLLRLDDRR